MPNQNVQEQLTAALRDVQESLQADHADLEVLGLNGSAADIRLVFNDDTCVECIVDKDILQAIMLMSLQGTNPEITEVRLQDPRDPAAH
jgi:hypothetical protein